MANLLSELEMAMWRIDNKDADYARMMSVGFLRENHAEIAAAVRDAAKWAGVADIVSLAGDESAGQVTTACGLLLIDRASTVNARKLELKFDGVTGDDGVDFGDWIITVKKAAMSAREGQG